MIEEGKLGVIIETKWMKDEKWRGERAKQYADHHNYEQSKCSFMVVQNASLIFFVSATIYIRDVLLILGCATKKKQEQHTVSELYAKPTANEDWWNRKRATFLRFGSLMNSVCLEQMAFGMLHPLTRSFAHLHSPTGTHVHNDELGVFRIEMMMYTQDD